MFIIQYTVPNGKTARNIPQGEIRYKIADTAEEAFLGVNILKGAGMREIHVFKKVHLMVEVAG